jgi:hypothetical protein
MTTRFITRLAPSAASGTSIMGYYETTYDELVAAFGEPDGGSDKTTAEWVLSINGTIVVIYDWKKDQTPKGLYAWHVGGSSRHAVANLEDLIEHAGLHGTGMTPTPVSTSWSG